MSADFHGSLFAADVLRDRVSLVTGASSGLGRHFAHLLSRHGARVIVAARRMTELEAVVSSIEAQGGRAHALALDVRDRAMVDDALRRAARTIGAPELIVNNSGVAVTKPVLNTTEDEWQRVIDTNLSGAFRVTRAAVELLREVKQGGVIVNIASVLAQRVAKQLAAYVASKAALVKLTEACALEFAPYGIRVNALAPGYIETDLNREFLRSPAGETLGRRVPLGRFGQPDDLDGALLLLASDAGRYITGSVITVDGGHGLAWL